MLLKLIFYELVNKDWRLGEKLSALTEVLYLITKPTSFLKEILYFLLHYIYMIHLVTLEIQIINTKYNPEIK